MKNIIIVSLLLLVNTISFAQSHDMRPGSTCKLIKTSVNTESMICPACATNDKKEKDAKNAEVKRRNDLLVAEAKAKNDAEQKAYRDKLAADKLKEGSGNVLINAQPTSTINKNEIDIVLDDKKLVEMKKYSIKYNEKKGQMNSPISISILYNSQPVFTTSEYTAINRVSDKALIFYGTKPRMDDCNETFSKNFDVFINEKGEPIYLGGINSFSFASEYNNVIEFFVRDGNCYPDNRSSQSLLYSSLRGNISYKYNLSDLTLISSKSDKIMVSCPCKN
jgi:hypothetical protein